MHPAKRLEIIADAPLVPRIGEALRTAGATGWSILPLLGGIGRSGSWRDDGLTAAERRVIVMAIAPEAITDKAVEALTPLLDSYRLLLTVSDVATVRPARFG